jgi:hypothetical protein
MKQEAPVARTESVEEIVSRLVGAWNSQDAAAFGALFMREARYRGTDGLVRHGRGRIETLVRESGPPLPVAIDGAISVDIQIPRAYARFRWIAVSTERSRRGTIDCVLVLEREGWRIESLFNAGIPSE